MSKNIFIFAGYAPSAYNGSNYQTAEGCRGSEIALVNLAESLAERNNVTVGYAPIIEGVHNNVTYIGWDKIQKHLLTNEIDVLIVSRYLNFFVEFVNTAKKTYLWFHDYYGLPWLNGAALPANGVPLLRNQLASIDGIVTLSDWHKEYVKSFYGIGDNKVLKIGNAINAQKFNSFSIEKKIKNRFIFTSANGGLEDAINVFVKYRELNPDAELHVFKNLEYVPDALKNKDGVIYRGIVPNDIIIEELIMSQFWIYPATVHETFCISALEARVAGCIPIVKCMGGMEEVLGGYSLNIDDPLLFDKMKNVDFIEKSRKEALSETWFKKSVEWESLFL
jgi:glycosyltransferase involved in cell wall biosynthesis